MSIDLDPTDALTDGAAEDERIVTVRRNVLLSGVVGGLALLLGFAYLVRGASFLDALVGLVLLGVAALNLPALGAAQVPVLVVDAQGVRFRIGLVWRGLPWHEIRQVVVEPATSPLREGRIVVVPRGAVPVLDDAGMLSAAHLRWNEYWYGAPISLPLGLTTVTDGTDLTSELVALADGRTEIVTMVEDEVDLPGHLENDVPDPVAVAVAYDEPAYDDYEDFDEDSIIVPVSFDQAPFHQAPFDQAAELPVPDEEPAVVLPPAVLPLRDLQAPTRVDVRLELVEDTDEPGDKLTDTFDHALPAWEHQSPVELVVDEEVELGDELTVVAPIGEPAPKRESLIGLKVLHAREMLDMSIDELSQRTRIRPHVLEAIEEDDFGPCGGDFYARGHLTAISRVLGLTLEPLMKTYDEQYAQAPINARRVFEAELSSGLSGGMRATLGGPRWSLVVGAVLSLTMIWGLARMFAGAPEQLTAAPDSGSQTAGLAANRTPITSPRMKTTPMTVTASFASTHVVVKDRNAQVLWSGDLALGRHRKVVGLAPFTVSADNAGAVQISVKGENLGTIGTAGTADAKSFG